MGGVKILRVVGIVRLMLLPPGELVVVQARGRAVVADGEYAVVGVRDAGAHLRVGVLAAQARGYGGLHEELVPADDVSALARHGAHLSLRYRC